MHHNQNLLDPDPIIEISKDTQTEDNEENKKTDENGHSEQKVEEAKVVVTSDKLKNL